MLRQRRHDLLTPFQYLARRSYQHSSPHAPANRKRAAEDREPPVSATTSGSDEIAYSRHELLADWHSFARKVSPLDVRWHGKDQIDANYLLVYPDGKIEEPSEKLDKQAVIERFGLLPRDLRSLDAHILDVRPALVICQKSVILCSPIVRAIIAGDVLVLIGTDKNNPICDEEQSRQMGDSLQTVMKYLELSGSASGSKNTPPFELRALEALLLLTVRGLKNVVTELQERVYRTIPQLRFGVSPAELRDLLECKRTVEDCLMSGRAMQNDDLAAMYLTDKMHGVKRDRSDHQIAELLLEYYERRLDETSESCERLSTLLSDVDSNISLVLQSTRVRLQNLELQTAIGTLALGAGAAVSSIFGMNLASHLEEHPSAFYWTTGSIATLMIGITAICWVRLIRARRSQLFLRSTLQPRQDEELTNLWKAGPVAPIKKSDIRDVDVHKEVDEATGVGKEKRANGKKGEGDEGKEELHPMAKKDGTTL
ncbi:mitochondrial inner membrane magnesium transporter mrs2 [Rhodotorula toruloides]|uniref:Mitochondrial inner membrane magnesium transporter mrs2 n=1 Tax=Rhodotorula toruloides TaxID=5286 RepID=A0A511KHR8_RHOTO|nr:mitochondrial inner membrane magnesium transporter mrs2 [Rhodotorula toruloides]